MPDKIKEQVNSLMQEFIKEQVNSLMQEFFTFYIQGQYDKAVDVAVTICDKLSQSNDFDLTLLNNVDFLPFLDDMASNYLANDNSDKAEMIYLKVLAIRSRLVGENDQNYIITLSRLAELYFNKGYFLAGLRIYKEAIEYFDKSLSIDPNYADALEHKKIAEEKLQNRNS